LSSLYRDISAVTDISANIFTLLILILIIMLAARGNSSPPQVIHVETDTIGVERAPLGSDELFDLLYARRASAQSTKIDLFAHGIDVISAGKTQHFTSVEAALARLNESARFTGVPVGVYVFSHRFYRDTTIALKTMGSEWREVSVPQALRDSSAKIEGQGWSTGFFELIVRSTDRAQFRNELAQLLQASSVDGHFKQSERQAADSSGHRPERIIDRLGRWSRIALDAMSIFIGLIFVGWVETRRRLNGQCYVE
jgi:hypothetical protein